MYEGVKKLEPGKYLSINNTNYSNVEPKSYWQLKYEPNFNFSYSDWVDSTEALIRDGKNKTK